MAIQIISETHTGGRSSAPFSIYEDYIIKFRDTATTDVLAEITVNGLDVAGNNFLTQKFTIYPDDSGDYIFNFKQAILNIYNRFNGNDLHAPLNGIKYLDIDSRHNYKIETKNNSGTLVSLESKILGDFILQLVDNGETLNIDEGYLHEDYISENGYLTKWQDREFDYTVKFTDVTTNRFIQHPRTVSNITFANVLTFRYLRTTNITDVGVYTIGILYGSPQISKRTSLKVLPNCTKDVMYIKWFNKYGGWDYWLFKTRGDRKTTSSISSTFQTGKATSPVGKNVNVTQEIYDIYLEDFQVTKLLFLARAIKCYVELNGTFYECLISKVTKENSNEVSATVTLPLNNTQAK